ncbi:hypothetical protein Q5752_005793 [Cryptotrichosporon argae]
MSPPSPAPSASSADPPSAPCPDVLGASSSDDPPSPILFAPDPPTPVLFVPRPARPLDPIAIFKLLLGPARGAATDTDNEPSHRVSQDLVVARREELFLPRSVTPDDEGVPDVAQPDLAIPPACESVPVSPVAHVVEVKSEPDIVSSCLVMADDDDYDFEITSVTLSDAARKRATADQNLGDRKRARTTDPPPAAASPATTAASTASTPLRELRPGRECGCGCDGSCQAMKRMKGSGSTVLAPAVRGRLLALMIGSNCGSVLGNITAHDQSLTTWLDVAERVGAKREEFDRVRKAARWLRYDLPGLLQLGHM